LTLLAQGLLLDLEGVLYQEGEAIAGAAETLDQLQTLGFRLRYLTNTTTQPRSSIVARLQALGFTLSDDQVFTPPVAAGRLLAARGITRVHLAAAASLAEDFSDFQLTQDQAEAVVMGDLYRGFDWESLNKIFSLVLQGADLVALHRNRYCRRDGQIALDLGPFVAAIEYATGQSADIVGKPDRDFFELAVRSLDAAPDDVVMVGDDLDSDIAGAQGAGLRAIQVETGKYRTEDLNHPRIRPDLRIRSIADLPAVLRSA